MPLLTQLQRIDVVYLLFNSWQCVFPLVYNCILRADMRMRSEAIDSEHARIAIGNQRSSAGETSPRLHFVLVLLWRTKSSWTTTARLMMKRLSTVP